MKRLRHKTKKSYIVNPLTIRAEIRRNKLLGSYLGHWRASAKVKGWGHTSGYIQVESKLIDCKFNYRTEYEDCYTNIYSVEVYLYAEYEWEKKGWTEQHTVELKKILNKNNLILSEY